MNKKVITLCAAALLFGGAGVNGAYAASKTTAVTYTNTNAIKLQDGVKIYLGGSDGNYIKVVNRTIESEEVLTLDDTTTDITKATSFEIRNCNVAADNSGVTFELYYNGSKLFVKSDGTAIADADGLKSKKSLFYTNSKTTELGNVGVTLFSVGSDGVKLGGGSTNATLLAYTADKTYEADQLKEYNASSTTFSFDFTNEELVGNEFKEVIPVTLSGETKTYFVKGKDADKFNPSTPATLKGLSILALDQNKRYGLNTKNQGEGYALRWVDAEKFLLDEDGAALTSKDDSLSISAFTEIKELDILNNPGVLQLQVTPFADVKTPAGEAAFDGGVYTVAAVKSSTSDTKAYVTTVDPDKTTWTNIKNAQLGDNTYFQASEFLKQDAMRVVSILVVSGKPGDNHYYHYLVKDNKTFKPASELDFSMTENQWVITGFDGKYELELANRLNSSTVLTLKLKKTEAGYEVTNGIGQVSGKNVVVKFLDLTTTPTDGFLRLTDEQIKNGIMLKFKGETPVAGEKEFYAVADNADLSSATNMKPSVSDENIITFYPVANVTKDVDNIKANTTYACLNAEGDVVSKEAENDMVVPTYKLAVIFDTDGTTITKGLKSDNTLAASAFSDFAFAKNLTGGYSLVSAGTNVENFNAAKAKEVTYSDSKTVAFGTTGVDRTNANAVKTGFATVEILSENLNTSYPAQPTHVSFNNERGSISVKDINGITEGALSSEGLVFWLDTVDYNKETTATSFYISRGIEGNESERLYMFNPIDSARVFNQTTAKYDYNDVYYYGEDAQEDANNVAKGTLKVTFTPAALTEEGLDNTFKFNITMKDEAVADEYVISSAAKVDDKTLYVGQKNGVVLLGAKEDAMVFTVSKEEAPTSNESVSASEVKVVANNGSIVVKNAAGKNVVVSTILGQVVANEVLTSDNATINVPAGIVVVAVEGESFKVNVK